MSIELEINRIIGFRDSIRDKLIQLGIVGSDAKLENITSAIQAIYNNGAVNAEVIEGNTYTIPAGYHNGTGTVTAKSDTTGDAEKYKLQSKEPITPTKLAITVAPDEGYYGLNPITVNPIPAEYQDVQHVDATSEDVLAGKIIVDAQGNILTGTMLNNGAIQKNLDVTEISYVIPKGYHNGNGTIQIVLEEKTITPTKEEIVVEPTDGKVLSKVVVAPIPEEYIITEDATAAETQILNGKTAYARGSKLTGTMVDNGAAVLQIDGMKENEISIPIGYHNGEGKVTLTSSIEEALAAI